MPSDDKLPLPPASSLPHPVITYYCRIGRVMDDSDLGYVGYRSRILPAIPGDWVEYCPYICWYNRASKRWEALPNGYTTEEPNATHPLPEVEEWWEDANYLANRRAARAAKRRQATLEGSSSQAESGDGAESGDKEVSAHEAESTHEEKSAHEADQDHQMEETTQLGVVGGQPTEAINSEMDNQRSAYPSESTLSPSDYSESKKAELLRREQARKNRGLGHDVMDTAEEEEDDEKKMAEEDEQERRRQMKNKKVLKKPSGTSHAEDKVSRGRHRRAKDKRAANKPSMDDGGSDSDEDFSQKLHRLARSKRPAQRPSADGDGSDADADEDEEGPSEMPTARLVASTKALGKKRDVPAESMKRGPYTAHETQQAMDLAETIVAFCRNMGRTPESVLRKGGFNVSLSREASRWDVWQMYLRHQTYNPSKSKDMSYLSWSVSESHLHFR